MRLPSALAAASLAYLLAGSALGLTPSRLSIGATTWAAARSLHGAGRDWLHQADARLSVAQFVAMSIGLGIVGGIVTLALAAVAPLVLVGGAAAASAPTMVVARRRRRLIVDRLAGWPDALRDLITYLRSGGTLHRGLCQLALTGPQDLRSSFARYSSLAAALDQKAALEVVRDELAHPLSDRIIDVLLVAFDQGSSAIVDVLEDLARAATDDLRLTAEIETAQLETKLEARGAALLPFVVLLLLCSTSIDYRDFYRTPAGWLVVLVGAALSTIGLLVIGRLGRIPVETRTLGGGGAP